MDTIAAVVMLTVSSTIAFYHLQDHCCFGCRNSFHNSFRTDEDDDDDDIHHNDYDSSDGTHKGIVIQTTTTTEKSGSPHKQAENVDGVDSNEREIKEGGGDNEMMDHPDGISELSSACHSFSVSSHNGNNNNKKKYCSSPSNLLPLPNSEDDIIGPLIPLSHPISILNHRRYAFGNTNEEQREQLQQEELLQQEDQQESRTDHNSSSTPTRKVGFATTTTTKGRKKRRNIKRYTQTRTIDPRL